MKIPSILLLLYATLAVACAVPFTTPNQPETTRQQDTVETSQTTAKSLVDHSKPQDEQKDVSVRLSTDTTDGTKSSESDTLSSIVQTTTTNPKTDYPTRAITTESSWTTTISGDVDAGSTMEFSQYAGSSEAHTSLLSRSKSSSFPETTSTTSAANSTATSQMFSTITTAASSEIPTTVTGTTGIKPSASTDMLASESTVSQSLDLSTTEKTEAGVGKLQRSNNETFYMSASTTDNILNTTATGFSPSVLARDGNSSDTKTNLAIAIDSSTSQTTGSIISTETATDTTVVTSSGTSRAQLRQSLHAGDSSVTAATESTDITSPVITSGAPSQSSTEIHTTESSVRNSDVYMEDVSKSTRKLTSLTDSLDHTTPFTTDKQPSTARTDELSDFSMMHFTTDNMTQGATTSESSTETVSDDMKKSQSTEAATSTGHMHSLNSLATESFTSLPSDSSDTTTGTTNISSTDQKEYTDVNKHQAGFAFPPPPPPPPPPPVLPDDDSFTNTSLSFVTMTGSSDPTSQAITVSPMWPDDNSSTPSTLAIANITLPVTANDMSSTETTKFTSSVEQVSTSKPAVTITPVPFTDTRGTQLPTLKHTGHPEVPGDIHKTSKPSTSDILDHRDKSGKFKQHLTGYSDDDHNGHDDEEDDHDAQSDKDNGDNEGHDDDNGDNGDDDDDKDDDDDDKDNGEHSDEDVKEDDDSQEDEPERD